LSSSSKVSANRSSDVSQAFLRRARQELARSNPDDLLYWTLAHREIGGEPISLPLALEALYADRSEFLVIQKAAQMGISEYLINSALFVADTGQGGRGVSLYLLPTGQMAGDFSQGRIEKAIQESAYLRSRIGRPARSGLRRAGKGHVYVRGSDSERALISVDADLVAFDELDHMADGVVEIGLHRLDSSRLRWARLVSTPSVPNALINERFLEGDQRYWFIRCEGCGTSQPLTWEDNVDENRAILRCASCGHPLDNQAQGDWVTARPGAAYASYHLSQLYSPFLQLEPLIEASRSTNPFERQQFHNSSLGLPYLEEGAGVTTATLEACMDNPEAWPEEGELAMGVDVGRVCHYVVRRRVADRYFLIDVGTMDSLHDIGRLIRHMGIRRCVVDANPETHAARELQAGFPGIVSLCYYSESTPHRRHERGAYHVNRTFEIDEVVSRFATGSNRVSTQDRYAGGKVRANRGEYFRQLMGETRIYERDSTGNPVARYRGGGNSHWLHAEVYCSLASRDLPGGQGLKPVVATSRSRAAAIVVSRSGSRRDGMYSSRRAARREGQQADHYMR
jgi:Phage terminase large subunit gpA, ATPase domain